jgi:transcriptional regulator with XRE-family HTH domain
MFTSDNWASDVRAFRLRNGLTQEALGEKVGVSGATVSKWETGREQPSLSSQIALRRVAAPAPTLGALGLLDIIDATGDIAVLMDRHYRMVRASGAHRKLLRYDLSDIAGVKFPMWTEAMFATMEPIGGPQGWWKNGVRRISFDIMRKPGERAANTTPIFQKVTTITVRDSMGEPYRFAITRTIPESEFILRPPQIEYF